MYYADVSANTSTMVYGIRTYTRKLIVLHTSMGYDSLSWVQGGSAIFGSPASCDFLIGRGGVIFQITKPRRFSYHTGRARWGNLQEYDGTLNRQAIGIELECAEQHGQILTDIQYIACAALMRALWDYHELDESAVTTHALIALPAGRKTDPRHLDWNVMQNELLHPSVESSKYDFPERLP